MRSGGASASRSRTSGARASARSNPALRQLGEQGCIEVDEADNAGGGRERIRYRLTPAGRDELKRWLAQPVQASRPRNELLLKLFFGRHASPGVIEEHVVAFRRRIEADRARYAEIRARIENEIRQTPEAEYWLLTLRYGEIERDALMRWTEEALARVRTIPSGPSPSRRPDAQHLEDRP